jgi:hypothetical protein
MVELTSIDSCVEEPILQTSQLSIMGIHLGTPIKEIYKSFNLSSKDLEKKGEYLFLKIVPGFKIRIKKQLFTTKIDALIITSEFQNRLLGTFSELFEHIQSKDQFMDNIKKYFSEPDLTDSTPRVAGFETNRMIYNNGIIFNRFQTPKGSTLAIVFTL